MIIFEGHHFIGKQKATTIKPNNFEDHHLNLFVGMEIYIVGKVVKIVAPFNASYFSSVCFAFTVVLGFSLFEKSWVHQMKHWGNVLLDTIGFSHQTEIKQRLC